MIRLYDYQPRCPGCNKLLAEEVTRPWEIRCVRCKRLCRSSERVALPMRMVLERSPDDSPRTGNNN